MLLLLSADFFQIKFFKKFFQEHSVSNCLDPDQDSSANDKSLLARKRVKWKLIAKGVKFYEKSIC